MLVCDQCGQENPDQARFCLACGSPFALAAEPIEERKLVTALFCDIVGSTASAERLDPEDVRARLVPYFARVRREIVRHGGVVEKFIGDAVVGLFGAPAAHEDDPERAVRAALAIRGAIADLNEADAWLDLKVRIGVNTGEALVVVGARASEGEATAAGDVMNTAARLQSAAPVDGVVVGEQTQAATAQVIEYREVEPIAAKGKAEPVRAWEARGIKDRPVLRTPTGVPLIGRDDELDELDRAWASVRREGSPALALVTGPPGIGKSRLLAEFAERVRRTGTLRLGRCLPYGEGITYWPVGEAIKDAAGIQKTDPPAEVSQKLGALLETLPTDDQDELRTIAAALSNLLGVPTSPAGTYLVAEIGQTELHWGVRRAFELRAAEAPLALVIEDLHWAEPTLLELLRFIADGSAPILIVGSARPELLDGTPTYALGGHVIALEPLTEEVSGALVRELAGASGISGRALDAAIRNAGGNPLFLEETVRMLEARNGGADDGGDLPVPTSLQALIASRLDQLPPAEKRLAQYASVIGTVFWPGAIAHLGDDLNGDLPARLGELERRDLVRIHPGSTVAGEREYAFKHVLIREVAYGQLPKGRRAGLHLRFADWITALHGGDDEYVEIIAYHLEQSCRLAQEVQHRSVPPPVERAVDALVGAGEKSERREGFREADRYYSRALELLGEDRPELAARLRVRRGLTLVALGELHGARTYLAQAVAESTSPELRCEALAALGNVDVKQGRAADGRALLAEARDLASGIGDRALLVRTTYEAAYLRAWFEGETADAVEELTHALALAEELGDRPLVVGGLLRLGTIAINTGALAEAERRLERARALAGQLGSHRDEARATYFLSRVKYYRGEPAEAERLALQAYDWLERTGDSYLQVQNLRGLAKYALARGDPALAETRLRDALPLALEGGGWLVVEIYRYLAETLVALGRLDEAAELVAFAARNLAEEEVYARAAVLVAEAVVATASEEPNTATAAFEEALRILEDQDLLIDLGETRIAFARALGSFGEATGARTELERARALFRRMEAQTPLDEIDRELERLAEEAGGPAPSARS